MNRPNAKRGMNGHYSEQISATAAESQLAMLLSAARCLDGFTAEGLAKSYRVKPGRIAAMLAEARAGRGGHD